MIGHILTTRHYDISKRDFVFTEYVIVGIRKDRFGQNEYYVNQWDAEKQNFTRLHQNNYFIHGISETAYPMTEAQRAMSRSIHYGQLSALCERIRRKYAVPLMIASKRAIGQETAYASTRFTLNDEYEMLWEDKNADIADRAKAKRNRYEAMRYAELVFAGVLQDASLNTWLSEVAAV
jgi:hypothetical protein